MGRHAWSDRMILGGDGCGRKGRVKGRRYEQNWYQKLRLENGGRGQITD